MANQLLTRHSLNLTPCMNGNPSSFWNVIKVDFFLSARCLYNKQNNTWLLGDMEFLLTCSTRYPTRSLRSLVRYRVEYWKRNSASPRAFVLFFMYFVSVCISGYRMEQNKTLIMAPNLEMSVFAIAHVLLSNLYHIKTHLTVPHVGNN